MKKIIHFVILSSCLCLATLPLFAGGGGGGGGGKQKNGAEGKNGGDDVKAKGDKQKSSNPNEIIGTLDSVTDCLLIQIIKKSMRKQRFPLSC